MIEESMIRKEEPKPKHEPTAEERQRAADTLAYLESLPWRPFGVEW